MLPLLLLLVLAGAVGGLIVLQVRQRHADRWLLPYLAQRHRLRPPAANEEVHLILCVADHWEPKFQEASAEVARARVRRWVEGYPRQFGRFRDSDGRSPRHTF